MKNEKVVQFYKNCGSGKHQPSRGCCSVISVILSLDNLRFCTFPLSDQTESSSVTEEASDAESSYSSTDLSPGTGDAFKDYVDKMRAFVSEMVTNLSSIMQDLIATSDEGQSKGRLKTLIMNTKKDIANDRSSFVLLAIATIFVVLLKRA